MKIPLTVTSRGVITRPARLRQALRLKADDILIAETTPEGILLRRSVTEVYSDARIGEFDEGEAQLKKALERRKKKAAR